MYPPITSPLRQDFRAFQSLLILLLLFLWKMDTYNGEFSPNTLSLIQRKLRSNIKVIYSDKSLWGKKDFIQI